MELFFIALILLPFVAYLISQGVDKYKQKSESQKRADEHKFEEGCATVVLVIINIIAIVGTGGYWLLGLIAFWAIYVLSGPR